MNRRAQYRQAIIAARTFPGGLEAGLRWAWAAYRWPGVQAFMRTLTRRLTNHNVGINRPQLPESSEK